MANEMRDFIVNHPKLAAYGLDEEYRVLAGLAKGEVNA